MEAANLQERQICAQLFYWPEQDELHFSKAPMVRFTKIAAPASFAELKKEIAQQFAKSEDQITVHNYNLRFDNPKIIDSLNEFLAYQQTCKKTVVENLKVATFLKLYVYDKKWVDYSKKQEKLRAKF